MHPCCRYSVDVPLCPVMVAGEAYALECGRMSRTRVVAVRGAGPLPAGSWSANAQEAEGSQQGREGVPAWRRASRCAGHAELHGTCARRPGPVEGPDGRQPQRLVQVARGRPEGRRGTGSNDHRLRGGPYRFREGEVWCGRCCRVRSVRHEPGADHTVKGRLELRRLDLSADHHHPAADRNRNRNLATDRDLARDHLAPYRNRNLAADHLAAGQHHLRCPCRRPAREGPPAPWVEIKTPERRDQWASDGRRGTRARRRGGLLGGWGVDGGEARVAHGLQQATDGTAEAVAR